MTIASQHRGLRMAAALAFLLPAGLLAGAYISQYGFGLYPCEMCWWQRYPHFFALPLALLSVMALQRGQEQGARRWATLAAIAVAVSGTSARFTRALNMVGGRGSPRAPLPSSRDRVKAISTRSCVRRLRGAMLRRGRCLACRWRDSTSCYRAAARRSYFGFRVKLCAKNLHRQSMFSLYAIAKGSILGATPNVKSMSHAR